MDETLYLTVNLIDRFLAVQPVVRKKLQLVGVTAMLLACKYEEVSVPVVEDLILISDKAYSRIEVLQMVGLGLTHCRFCQTLFISSSLHFEHMTHCIAEKSIMLQSLLISSPLYCRRS